MRRLVELTDLLVADCVVWVGYRYVFFRPCLMVLNFRPAVPAHPCSAGIMNFSESTSMRCVGRSARFGEFSFPDDRYWHRVLEHLVRDKMPSLRSEVPKSGHICPKSPATALLTLNLPSTKNNVAAIPLRSRRILTQIFFGGCREGNKF